MPIYNLSCTSNVAFAQVPKEVSMRALSVVAVPAQPVFSHSVSVVMRTSYSHSLTSTLTLSQTVAKNNIYRPIITHTITFPA